MLRTMKVAGALGLSAFLAACGGGGGGGPAAAVATNSGAASNPPSTSTTLVNPPTLAAKGKGLMVIIPDVSNISVSSRTQAGGDAVALSKTPTTANVSLSGSPSFSSGTMAIAGGSGGGINSYNAPSGSILDVTRTSSLGYLSDASFGSAFMGGSSTTPLQAMAYHHGNPTGNIPTNVTATYNGLFAGSSFEHGNNANAFGANSLVGDARVTANFGAGTMTGSVTNISQEPVGLGLSAPAGYDLNLIGNISGNTYSGSVGFATPGGAASGAVTHSNMTGGFYGANAAETAGALSVTGTPAGQATPITAIGSFGAVK